MVKEIFRLYTSVLRLSIVIGFLVIIGLQNLFADQKILSSISSLKLPEPLKGVVTDKMRRNNSTEKEKQLFIIVLKSGSATRQKASSLLTTPELKNRIQIEQKDFIKRCKKIDPGIHVIAQTQLVLNAVFVEVESLVISTIAKDPSVLYIKKSVNYQKALSETVPYIGASDLQIKGLRGNDTKVAVLDSGVDYTHRDMGGEGTLEHYEAAYGKGVFDRRNTTLDGLFPTTKVIGGFDFVGEFWTGDIDSPPLRPDPDPIDFDGHGTHAADIIGGVNGVAPETSIYAIKVCSSTTPACSDIAIIQGVEFTVDPNRDGNTSDAVDIINLSLGSVYGQPFDDALSIAVENATTLGVLTVAAAGNSEDSPYSIGTPAASPSALAVAETHVPSAILDQVEIIEPVKNAGLADAMRFSWSGESNDEISGLVLYGDGKGKALNGCNLEKPEGKNPFSIGSLSGRIVMVDRGVCRFDEKIENIEEAGGVLGIVGLVSPGDPFSGGGDPIVTIPGFMISQSTADIIRSGNAIVSFDPANGLSGVMSTVSSSARGPQDHDNRIKPDLGAPGASLSAEVGTGVERTSFGGTSGAAPMVSGAVALLKQARPDLSPLEIKALLMNTSERDIKNKINGALAPITRIGAGEIRVDKAVSSDIAVWNLQEPTAGLSFGFVDVTDKVTLSRQLLIKNYSPTTKQIEIKPLFRFQEDIDTGALQLEVEQFVTVNGNSEKIVEVIMTIDGSKLPDNQMSSGDAGIDSSTLTANEYDGYIELIIDSTEEKIGVPWHILPRKASSISIKNIQKIPDSRTRSIQVSNTGHGVAQLNAYSLLAISRNRREGREGAEAPRPDIRAVGIKTTPVVAGFCSEESSFVWSFAVNTWERQSHLVPVSHAITLDTNRDGITDYTVRNIPLFFLDGLNDGREVTIVVDESNGEFSTQFFTEHATNTGNTVLHICAEQAGLTEADILSRNIDAAFSTEDIYFGSPGDSIDGFTIAPLGERFYAISGDINGNESGGFTVFDNLTFSGNTDDIGLLLFTNSDRGAGNNRGGATQKTEAIIINIP